MRQQGWSILFAVSIAVLMATILAMRSDPVSAWVLVVYPVTGGLLGLTASRTSPSAEQMAWIETGTIAAAAVVVLALLVNLLLVDMLVAEMRSGAMMSGSPPQKIAFFGMPATAVVLWWALQRRLSRLRLAAGERGSQEAGIPAE